MNLLPVWVVVGIVGFYLLLWILHYIPAIPRGISSVFFNYAAGKGIIRPPTSIHSSHRGGSAERVENTIAAFDHAIACGSQHLELDVYRTADDVVVVFHDKVTDRVTNVRGGTISQFPFAQLPSLLLDPQLPPGFHNPSEHLSLRDAPLSPMALSNSNLSGIAAVSASATAAARASSPLASTTPASPVSPGPASTVAGAAAAAVVVAAAAAPSPIDTELQRAADDIAGQQGGLGSSRGMVSGDVDVDVDGSTASTSTSSDEAKDGLLASAIHSQRIAQGPLWMGAYLAATADQRATLVREAHAFVDTATSAGAAGVTSSSAAAGRRSESKAGVAIADTGAAAASTTANAAAAVASASPSAPLPPHLAALVPDMALSLRIPTLRSVFDRYPGVYINIDVKENDDKLIAAVGALVREYSRERLTVWGNFAPKTCEKLNALNPRVPTMCSATAVLWIIFRYWLGILPFTPIKQTCLQVPLFGKGSRAYIRKAIEGKSCLVRCFASCLTGTVGFLLERPLMLRHLRQRGMHILFWTVDEDEDFQRAFDLGAHGVMTDRPSRLTAWLDTHRPGWRVDGARGLPMTSANSAATAAAGSGIAAAYVPPIPVTDAGGDLAVGEKED